MYEHNISADSAERVLGAFGFIDRYNAETETYEQIPLDAESEVLWQIETGSDPGGDLESETTNLSQGFAFNTLYTTRKAGDRFQVRAKLTKAVYDGQTIEYDEEEAPTDTTEYLHVVPGSAYEFDIECDRTEYPADELSTAHVTVDNVKDQHGNVVEDGRGVQWFLDGLGDIVDAETQTVLSDGGATATVKPGFLADEQTITARIDGATREISITVNGLVLTIAPAGLVLDPNANPQATFQASVKDANNNLVSDGTKVTWFASNGYIVGQPTVTSGLASATLSLNSPHKPGAVAVDGSILVAVMSSNFVAALRVEVDSSGAIKVQAAKRVLAGDQVNDEVVQITADDGGPRNVTVHARSQLRIQGEPNAEASVSLDALGEMYLELIGPNPSGIVQFNAQGEADVELRSLGLMLPDANPEFPVITVQDLDTNEEKQHEVAVAPSGAVARAKNLALGFLWGEGEGLEGFAGDVAAGIFIWGDLRDVVKELGKLAPGGEEVDWVNFGLAAGGLALEVAPGAGDALDAIIAVIRSAIKRVPKPLRALLVRELKEIFIILKNNGLQAAIDYARKLADFLVALIALGAAGVEAVCKVIKSAVDLRRLVRLFNKLGSGILTKIISVVNNPSLGEQFCTQVLDALGRCSDAALDAVKSMPNLWDVFARAQKKELDPEKFAKALDNANLFTHYSKTQYLDALDNVLIQSPDVPGLKNMFNTKNIHVSGDDGPTLEIMVAGRDARAGNKVQNLGGDAMDRDKIDVITDVAAYQAKRSSNAVQGAGEKYAAELKKQTGRDHTWQEGLEAYLKKGQAKAAALNKSYKLAIPSGVTLHPTVQAVVDKVGITVDVIVY